MTTVQQWTGREARALRAALRLSTRGFAEHLGVALRTVAKWESLGSATVPRPGTQAILDTALARADTSALTRFRSLLPSGEYGRGVGAAAYEAWTDDIDRAIACLSRQNFTFAAELLDRWLGRHSLHGLDDKGRYLYGRSLVLRGDLRRDQGAILGPLSAHQCYATAHQLFSELEIPRRVAQVELSLAIVDEMAGCLEASARQYERLAADERIGGRDRARAKLWVGTALSKDGNNEYAAHIMASAIHDFEDLGEPEDWSVAHQKLVLAHRGAGDLARAVRCIDTAQSTGTADSPMQRVRLDTAYGHVLLSDPATRGDGLAVLDQAARTAQRYGLTHQLRSMRGHPEEGRAGRGPGMRGRASRGEPVADREQRTISDEQFHDASLIWDYHQMGHTPRPCSAAIGLGSHDLGVAGTAADLYHAGHFPVLVFTGGNSPTTRARFPRGEAVHFREHALGAGVPDSAILVEPHAANTGQNISLSRELLEQAGVQVDSLLLISKPYMERRSYATCRRLWPDPEIVCASEPLELDDYIKSIGDEKLVVDMLVGDLQRVIEYPRAGFAVEQEVPGDVCAAYERLLSAGFDSRLIS